MTVGLYDLDLWHSRDSYPNLELMKIYNFLYNKNEKVVMMKPTDDEDRFTQIIYFKDSPSLLVPKNLNLYGERKKVYGYGFFRKTGKLIPEIAKLSPMYLPYDAWTDKLKNTIPYDKIKKSSIVRIETEDFADYRENSEGVSIVDRDCLYLKNFEDFLKKYKKRNLMFFHTLAAKDVDTAVHFIPYAKFILGRNIYIDFNYNEDFFFEYYNTPIRFNLKKKTEESLNNYYLRLIKMGLWYKKNGEQLQYSFINKIDDFHDFILNWITNSKIQSSYQDFYQNNYAALNKMNNSITEIRLLLKQNPKTITRDALCLQKNLPR